MGLKSRMIWGVVIALLTGAAGEGTSSNMVIGQVYGGGGNSGAMLTTTTLAGGTTSTTLVTITTTSTTTATIPAGDLIFPHIADGGGYRTSLLLTNGSNVSTTASVIFTDSQGEPLSVTIDGVTSHNFSRALPAAGAVKLETSGTPTDVQVGWARVTATPATEIRGNAVFQLFEDGKLFSEASVPASIPGAQADFFADEESGFNTGFAVANPTSEPALGTITLNDLQGNLLGSLPITLLPGHHMAVFLFQLFPGSASGRAQINLTSGDVSVTALRFHTSSIFSTVSVGQRTITALFSPLGGIRARIVSEIDQAKGGIDIAIFSFTSNDIREALIRARARGVVIRIIADEDQADGLGGEIPTLESMGFNVKRSNGGSSSGDMHNKYMIIDARLLFTGSYNWSSRAENDSFENAIFIEGSPVILRYIQDFNRIWAK